MNMVMNRNFFLIIVTFFILVLMAVFTSGIALAKQPLGSGPIPIPYPNVPPTEKIPVPKLPKNDTTSLIIPKGTPILP